MGGISLSPRVSTLSQMKQVGKHMELLPLPLPLALHSLLLNPGWSLARNKEITLYDSGAVPGSRTPLTAVTTSRCSRGEQEAFPAFPFPLILTSACCIHRHLSKHTRLLWFWFMWLNMATVPNWACWVSYSTNVCNAQLGNNLPLAIQLLSAGDGVMKNHRPSISSRSQVPSEVQLQKVQFSKL